VEGACLHDHIIYRRFGKASYVKLFLIAEKRSQVPEKPSKQVEEERPRVNKKLLKRLEEVLRYFVFSPEG
jgi:hypothetical protein